jgi:hypothetical protein
VIPLPVIEGYASQVAHTQTVISCDAPSTFDTGELGYVVWVDGIIVARIHLPTPTCQRLMHADTGQLDPADFLTLEHEAQHIALYSQDECLVEQTALANVWPLVRLFRLAAWRTRTILGGLRAVDARMPAAYHADPVTGAC